MNSDFVLKHSEDKELCKQILIEQDSLKKEFIKLEASIESKEKDIRQERARERTNQLQEVDNNIQILVSN